MTLLAAWRFIVGLPHEVWFSLAGAALVVAALGAHDIHDTRISRAASKATRDSIVTAANDIRNVVWPRERAAWQRTEDSLRLALSKRDTALVERIRTVQRLVHDTIRETVRDTVRVTVEPLRNACTALANDCNAFRVTVMRSLAVSDSLRRADSVAVHALSVGLVDARRSFASAVKWRGVERTACVMSVAGVVLWGATR